MENTEKEIWCIVANVKKEIPYGPGGEVIKSGLKKFKAGAKVSVVGSYPGMCESLVVIGQERNSGKYINCVVRADKIENMRIKRIYRPQTVEFLETFYPNGAHMVRTKDEAENLCKAIPVWAGSL